MQTLRIPFTRVENFVVTLRQNFVQLAKEKNGKELEK